MSIHFVFPNPDHQQRLRAGPLADDINGFAPWLAGEGYSRSTARDKLQLTADLSLWLAEQGLAIDAVNEQRVAAFLHARKPRRGDPASGQQLLAYLRKRGRVPAALCGPPADSALERIARTYQRFLIEQRAVSPATVKNSPAHCACLSRRSLRLPGNRSGEPVGPDANQFRQARGGTSEPFPRQAGGDGIAQLPPSLAPAGGAASRPRRRSSAGHVLAPVRVAEITGSGTGHGDSRQLRPGDVVWTAGLRHPALTTRCPRESEFNAPTVSLHRVPTMRLDSGQTSASNTQCWRIAVMNPLPREISRLN